MSELVRFWVTEPPSSAEVLDHIQTAIDSGDQASLIAYPDAEVGVRARAIEATFPDAIQTLQTGEARAVGFIAVAGGAEQVVTVLMDANPSEPAVAITAH